MESFSPILHHRSTCSIYVNRSPKPTLSSSKATCRRITPVFDDNPQGKNKNKTSNQLSRRGLTIYSCEQFATSESYVANFCPVYDFNAIPSALDLNLSPVKRCFAIWSQFRDWTGANNGSLFHRWVNGWIVMNKSWYCPSPSNI